MNRLVPVLALLAACKPSNGYVCDARVSDTVNTVLIVDVTPPDGSSPTEARVVFGEDGALDHQTPASALAPGGTTTFPLLGLHALAETSWHVLVGEESVCDGVDVTKNLPSDLAEFEVLAYDAERTSDVNYVLQSVANSRAGLYVVDRDGAIVWYQRNETHTWWLQPYWRGDHVLHNDLDGGTLQDVGNITRRDLDGEVQEVRRTGYAHHSFIPLEPDVYAYLRLDVRPWNDPVMQVEQAVAGDAVVEQAADGTERIVFSLWDWLQVRVTEDFYDAALYGPQVKDWSHGNAIDWRRGDDTLLVTFSHLDTLVQIDRASGQPVRWFGIDGEDPYGYSEGSRHMNLPHDATWTGDDTLMVYMTDDTIGRSGAIEYRIDEENHVLDEVWSYGFGSGEPIHKSFPLGQARRQTNGNTMVKWSKTGRMVEVTPDNQIVWDLHVAAGGTLNEADFIEDIYEVTP